MEPGAKGGIRAEHVSCRPAKQKVGVLFRSKGSHSSQFPMDPNLVSRRQRDFESSARYHDCGQVIPAIEAVDAIGLKAEKLRRPLDVHGSTA